MLKSQKRVLYLAGLAKLLLFIIYLATALYNTSRVYYIYYIRRVLGLFINNNVLIFVIIIVFVFFILLKCA
jgi:hypothetical protein